MSPSSVILFTILVVPIILLLLIAFFWKRARIVLLIFAIVISSVETYYVLYKQDSSFQKWYEYEEAVNTHLKKTYPEDKWISRRATETLFPATGVEIIFVDETEVAYLYLVEEGVVNFVGYSSEEGNKSPKRE